MKKIMQADATEELQPAAGGRNLPPSGPEPPRPTKRSARPSAAGGAVADIDPATKKRIKILKTVLTRALNRGLLMESTKGKMREAARRAPHLFGKWKSI